MRRACTLLVDRSDVALGEGTAIGVRAREFTPGTAEMVGRFLASAEYAALR